MLMLMFSVYVVSIAHLSQGEEYPHKWFSFKFFLTLFEGLNTEGVTTVQLVKPSKAHNVCDFGL